VLPVDFRKAAAEVLVDAPDITAAVPWDEGVIRPCGLVIGFSSGSRLWLAITTVSAQAAGAPSVAASSMPVTPAAAVLPDLYEGGAVTSARATGYVAAVLRAASISDVVDVYPYPDSRHPGLGVRLVDGGRIYLPVVHTARRGQDRGRAWKLQSVF
jgi:hypothetical protein